MELAMIGDQIVPLAEARISAHDRSIYFGDGVYEVVRYCGGRLFAMDAHIARLKNSLREMDMLAKVDLDVIRRRVDRAVAEAGITDALVYFHLSRGSALRSHDYSDDWEPGFLLTVRAYHERDAEVRAITHPDWRWKRCDIKSLNLLANVLAKHAAGRAGAYEALLVDDGGLITEATSSTVFMIKDQILRTAPLTANILPGITRTYLLEWAESIGLKSREECFTVAEALAADELLLTGTGTEVMGITHLDGATIADGIMGSYTHRFHDRLREAMYETRSH